MALPFLIFHVVVLFTVFTAELVVMTPVATAATLTPVMTPVVTATGAAMLPVVKNARANGRVASPPVVKIRAARPATAMVPIAVPTAHGTVSANASSLNIDTAVYSGMTCWYASPNAPRVSSMDSFVRELVSFWRTPSLAIRFVLRTFRVVGEVRELTLNRSHGNGRLV